jgi:hypothetical protein
VKLLVSHLDYASMKLVPVGLVAYGNEHNFGPNLVRYISSKRVRGEGELDPPKCEPRPVRLHRIGLPHTTHRRGAQGHAAFRADTLESRLCLQELATDAEQSEAPRLEVRPSCLGCL